MHSLCSPARGRRNVHGQCIVMSYELLHMRLSNTDMLEGKLDRTRKSTEAG